MHGAWLHSSSGGCEGASAGHIWLPVSEHAPPPTLHVVNHHHPCTPSLPLSWTHSPGRVHGSSRLHRITHTRHTHQCPVNTGWKEQAAGHAQARNHGAPAGVDQRLQLALHVLLQA